MLPTRYRELFRGGLQSVPSGQVEAGREAIRNMIPSLVGQFISLFKDTTLAGVAWGCWNF